MRSKTITATLAVLVVAGLTLTAGLGAVGTVAAHDAGDRDDVITENTTASEDVAEIWVDVAGADKIDTADNTTEAVVIIEGVNGSDSTELLNESLTIEEGNVSTAAYETVENDSSDYEDYHIHVTTENGSSDYIDSDSTEWGTLTKNVGGGGGFLGGAGALGGGAGALILIGIGYVLLKED